MAGDSPETTWSQVELMMRFAVSIGGTAWLESAPIRLFADGAWQQLERTAVKNSTGKDELGRYSCVNVSWSWS